MLVREHLRRLAPRFGAEQIVRYGSLFLICLGLSVLAAWLFEWKGFLEVLPGRPIVTCDTALGIILAGAAIFSASQKIVRFSRVSGLLVAAFGAVYLIMARQHLWFSVHRYFPHRTAHLVFPLRTEAYGMAPAAAIIFLLLGVSIMLLAAQRPGTYVLNISAFLGLAINAIGVLGLLALLAGATTEPIWGGFLFHLAMPSALAACVIGIATNALFWTRSRQTGQQLPVTATTVTLLGLLLLFAGTDAAVLASANTNAKTRLEIAETWRQIKAIQGIGASVRKAETGQRGFLINHDRAYLKVHDVGVAEIQAAFHNLSDDRKTGDRAVLRKLTNEKLAELAETIALEQAGKRANAIAVVRSGRGLALMDRIDAEIAKLVHDLQGHLAQHLEANNASLQIMRRTVIAAYLVAFLLACFVVYLVRAEIRRRESIERALRESESDLEHKIAERTAALTAQTERLESEVAHRLKTETALLDSGERLRVALDFSKVAVWTWNVTNDRVSWSGPVEEVFGVTASELNSYAAFRLGIHSDDLDYVERQLAKTIQEGLDYSAEFRIVRPNGEVRWIAGLGGAVISDNGQLCQMSGVNFDISGRKMAEQKLEMVFETGAIGYFEWDIAKDEVRAHPTVWALYGAPEREGAAPAAWFRARQHPLDLERIEREMQAALKGEGHFDLEFRVVRPDGSIRWIACRGVVIRDAQGTPIQTHGLNFDITQRKTAELQVQESERQLAQQADAMPQIVWTARVDGGVDHYNQRWYEYTGRSYEETKDWGWNSVIHPDDLEESVAKSKKGMASGNAFELECRIRRGSDGSYRWHLARVVPYRDQDGTLLRWFGTSTDIHEQKTEKERLEAEVERHTKELRHSLTEKETLLKEVHHRVKNNLQVISSLLRMQEDSMKDQVAATALRESQQRVLSMALIHERLYGNQQMDEIDFGEYTQALVNELFYSYSNRNGSVTSRLSLSPVLLKIDQAIPCGLILNELVTNALKYAYPTGQSGEILIDLKATASGTVKLTVSDRGVGLPEGLNWKNSKSLGLPIVDILAKQLGGTFTVESRPGATFSLEFPKDQDSGVEAASAA